MQIYGYRFELFSKNIYVYTLRFTMSPVRSPNFFVNYPKVGQICRRTADARTRSYLVSECDQFGIVCLRNEHFMSGPPGTVSSSRKISWNNGGIK